ncbi:nonsense-mediated decay protein 4 [Suhomyces tanzawaensis NRRL Y-17324]|uniref:Nonsense-mediated decay protein 4 n=1 Tax=Suhomyces tanzawaensis NRRL Y-17324 TaxID=984487 RepID=A0A1E4SF07_9ASCO|nr:nonsense-mediated decay protein 4 [Suhomyces tanzawaensis NRRL Y-17324]ODV78097.1 nonsense-mediated decay protein 4 [Suhomyces tanzawaensis NRRL Y-17324]
MSLHLFGSGKSDDQASYAGSTNSEPDVPTRSVNIILDHTAFVRGIGNIKRWFNEEYVKANHSHDLDTKILLNMYIPSYTLHEFDFVKKGISMTATNAREAIRFIDKFIEKEEQGTVSLLGQLVHRIYLESPREAGPNWEKCQKYQVHTPKIRDFPNFKTKFDSHLLGHQPVMERKGHDDLDDLTNNFSNSFSLRESHKTNDIQYENSASYQNALANSDQDAIMPARLRYLIRSCIYKRFIEKSVSKNPAEQWKLVTEDPITKIWARCFGIDCFNVNETEVLMFQNHDVNLIELYNPLLDFSAHDEGEHESNILRSTIDTTQYRYESIDQRPKFKNVAGAKARKRKTRQVDGVVREGYGVAGDQVKMERFDAINYAPRGTGELWKP